MSKKITCLLLVVLMLLTTASALADSITKSYTAPHYEYYYDGTSKSFTKTVGTTTHTYLVKNNTTGGYGGATTQGTTVKKAGTCTSAQIITKPDFGFIVSGDAKVITVTFSGGKGEFVYKPSVSVASDGSHSAPYGQTTSSLDFKTASKQHSK